jgi:hypothetical protein
VTNLEQSQRSLTWAMRFWVLATGWGVVNLTVMVVLLVTLR